MTALRKAHELNGGKVFCQHFIHERRWLELLFGWKNGSEAQPAGLARLR